MGNEVFICMCKVGIGWPINLYKKNLKFAILYRTQWIKAFILMLHSAYELCIKYFKVKGLL